MKFRFIEFEGDIYLVVGIGYDGTYDPPDIFYAVLLEHSITRSLLFYRNSRKIPFSEATEIEDKNKIELIRVLFG